MNDRFERDQLFLTATLPGPNNKPKKVRFTIFLPDGKEDKQTVLGVAQGSGFVAQLPYELPRVPDAMASYELIYAAYVDGQEDQQASDSYTVWPTGCLLEAVDAETQAPLAGVPFYVWQGVDLAQKGVSNANNGLCGFKLERPEPFNVQLGSKWKGQWEGTGRKRRCLVTRAVTAAIVLPVPQSTPIRQLVNLESKDQGRDRCGSAVSLLLGAKQGGKPGDKVWVEATFGRQSKRTDPVPGISGVTVTSKDNEGKLYRGYVQLNQGLAAKVDLQLGLAGGDTCSVKVSGTEAGLNASADSKDADYRPDASISFVNYRRVNYELSYPADMAADLQRDLNNRIDLPDKLKSLVTQQLEPVYIEWVFKGSAEFPKEMKNIFPAAYMKNAAHVNIRRFEVDRDMVLLSSGWAKPLADKVKCGDPLCLHLWLCDGLFAANEGRTTSSVKMDAHEKTVQFADYVFEKSLNNWAASALDQNSLVWTADRNAILGHLNKMRFPILSTNVPAPPGDNDPKGTGTFRVKEMNTGKHWDMRFLGAESGDEDQLDPEHTENIVGAKEDLRNWVGERMAARTQAKNVLAFTIYGTANKARGKECFQKIVTGLKELLIELDDGRFPLPHPGLQNNGQAKSGPLHPSWFKFTGCHEMTISIPKDSPVGKLIGPADAQRCPVQVRYSLETGYSVLGQATGFVNKVLYPTTGVEAMAGPLLHELGHSLGMTVFAGRSWPPYGMPWPAHVDDASKKGIYYANPLGALNEIAGINGIRNGHRGPHCAYGLTTAQRAQISLTGMGGFCIMYGEGEHEGQGYCKQCQEYIRGRNMLDLRTPWSERSEFES